LLDKYDLSENTIVFHASDHGGISAGGKYKLYEKSLNVPFMVRWPGVIKPGTESHALISFVDVLPTMMELGGGEPSTEMDGDSFVNVLRGKASDHSQYVYGVMTSQGTLMSTVFPGRSIRSKQYKYIRNFNALEVVDRKEKQGEEVHPIIRHGAEYWAKTSPTEDELYDILKDPDEENNLASDPDYAGVIKELRNKLQEWMVEQNDFLAKPGFMPIIKCKLPHRVDIYSNNRKVPEHLQNILDDFEDWYVHEQR
jgi:N-sulfoglucosamine sulfohydrolase